MGRPARQRDREVAPTSASPQLELPMPSIFTRIVRGEIPCHRVAEDATYLAFMDIRPINPGHVLVIPKQEIDYIFDLPPALLGGLLPFAQPIARVLPQVVPCRRIGLLVAGLEVPHAHLHLVPITGEGELTFARAKPADQAELARLAERLRALLAGGPR
jgi:histidine triad (HIT) family protein